MHRYIKKPLEIEAVLWTGKNDKEILEFCNKAHIADNTLYVNTIQGITVAYRGEYIIKDVIGSFSVLDAERFEKTYLRIDE